MSAPKRDAALEAALRRVISHFQLGTRWPCPECDRTGFLAPLRTNVVRTEDGNEYRMGCWRCNADGLLADVGAALAPSGLADSGGCDASPEAETPDAGIGVVCPAGGGAHDPLRLGFPRLPPPGTGEPRTTDAILEGFGNVRVLICQRCGLLYAERMDS